MEIQSLRIALLATHFVYNAPDRPPRTVLDVIAITNRMSMGKHVFLPANHPS